MEPTREQLIAEIKRLRRKLEEAPKTFSADPDHVTRDQAQEVLKLLWEINQSLSAIKQSAKSTGQGVQILAGIALVFSLIFLLFGFAVVSVAG